MSSGRFRSLAERREAVVRTIHTCEAFDLAPLAAMAKLRQPWPRTFIGHTDKSLLATILIVSLPIENEERRGAMAAFERPPFLRGRHGVPSGGWSR